MATVTIGTNGVFVPTKGQIYGVYIAVLLVHGTICSVGAVKYIARAQSLITTVNIVQVSPESRLWSSTHSRLTVSNRLALVVIVALPVATPKEFKNTAAYAFGGFDNCASAVRSSMSILTSAVSGWPDGFAFLLSFLAPLWAVGAFDSTTHLSEEAKNASVAVPWALMGMTSVACSLGWGNPLVSSHRV